MFKKLFLNKITIFIFTLIFLYGLFYFFKKHPFAQSVLQEKNCSVDIKATLLNKKNFGSLFHGSNYFWNRDVRKRYKAIKIDIKNESEHNLVLDKNGIELALIDPLVIQKKLTSTFNIIPFVASGAASALCSFGFGLATLPTMLISGGVGTAAGFLKFDKSEEKLGQNIHKHSYDPTSAILIPKQNIISKIFFVENKGLKPDFNIKFFDLNLEKYFDFKVKIK
jgi:hypothetical protein